MTRVVPVLAACLLAPACRQTDAGGPPPPSAAPTAVAPVPDTHPTPIDCPLRKAGIDPHALKPFEDVEKYIAFLEREDRATWQKPDEVVAALHLAGDETVADLGAGSGYFTFRLARALPRGKVVAIDLQPEMIRHIHHRAMTEGVKNVTVQLADADDPKVPPGTDMVFVCDVLHHVRSRATWLAKLAGEMKRGATLALVEFKEGKLPQGPPEAVKIPRTEMERMLARAGFQLEAERKGLLPYQLFLLFRRR